MVRHIVIWNFRDELSQEEKNTHAHKMKQDIENLTNIIAGIVELNIYHHLLPSSSADVILNSLFESTEALDAYQIHPEHKSIAAYVGSVVKDRKCIDYIE